MLTVKQVATQLNCSDDLVLSLIDAKKLMAVNLAPQKGRRWIRIRQEWVDDFLASAAIGASDSSGSNSDSNPKPLAVVGKPRHLKLG